MACGRRFGKTIAAANEAIKLSLQNKTHGWIVAPTYDLTGRTWDAMMSYLPFELIRKINRAEHRIELINGSRIEFKTAENRVSLQGAGLDWLVIDEAASIPKDIWNTYLRPTLADKEGKGIFISTPKAHNWFFDLYRLGQEKNQSIYESWKFPSSANPFLKQSEIALMKKDMPERAFAQEILAEFIEEVGLVFRNVKNCVTLKGEQGYDPSKFYRMGVDLAKHQDFSVIIVVDEDYNVVYFDRFNQIDWAFQQQRIAAVANRYNAKVVIDSTGVGDPIEEALRRSGLNVQGFKIKSSIVKQQLIENLAMKIQEGQVHFWEIPELIHELSIFGCEQRESGTIKYEAPPGYHDDCVIALALAVFEEKPRLNFISLDGKLAPRTH